MGFFFRDKENRAELPEVINEEECRDDVRVVDAGDKLSTAIAMVVRLGRRR